MNPNLIQTKLLPPISVGNPLIRTHLLKRLDAGRQGKLTLTIAPAGYGKSTLISTWLASAKEPVVWFSLDEQDNELNTFLTYLVAALQSVQSDSMERTLEILAAPEIPPLDYITTTISQELAALSDPLVLVLDDFHQIHNSKVHAIVAACLQYQSPQLHIVIATRHDLPFSVTRLRANELLNEFRLADMRFSHEEVGDYVAQALPEGLSADSIRLLEERTEGWPAGLRLATQALRKTPARDEILRTIQDPNRHVMEYLLDEVLARQPEAVQTFLLRTSILDRFCARLCDALLPTSAIGDDSGTPVTSQSIIARLRHENLFLIGLDGHDSWCRYHHLFQDLLRHRLRTTGTADQIATFHRRAGVWLADHDLDDEALEHFLAAGDKESAISILVRQRYALTNHAQWQRLDQLLRRYPDGWVESHPELYAAHIWLLYHRGHWAALPSALQTMFVLLEQLQGEPKRNAELRGEMSALTGLLAFAVADVDTTISESRAAISETPGPLWSVRVLARAHLACGLLMSGDSAACFAVMDDGFVQEALDDDYFRATLLVPHGAMRWLTADLTGTAHSANRSLELSKNTEMRGILSMARCLLGMVSYQRNDLADAEMHFAAIARDPYLNYGLIYAHSAIGLALTLAARGRPEDAAQVVERAMAYMLQTGNTTLRPLVEAFQAELALRHGRLAEAILWAERLPGYPPLGPIVYLYAPCVTLVKVRLAQDTPASRADAAASAAGLVEFLRRTHNSRFLIDALALQALQKVAAGDVTAAQAALAEAVSLAEPGRIIRAFADLGSPLVELLAALQPGNRETQRFVREIIVACEAGAESATPTRALPGYDGEALTSRELDVVRLLARRRTDREIAQELVISLNTVRTHTKNLYAKLGVRSRRKAAEKAIQLNLVTLE